MPLPFGPPAPGNSSYGYGLDGLEAARIVEISKLELAPLSPISSLNQMEFVQLDTRFIDGDIKIEQTWDLSWKLEMTLFDPSEVLFPRLPFTQTPDQRVVEGVGEYIRRRFSTLFNRVVRITAGWSGHEKPMFLGFITQVQPQWSNDGFVRVSITALDYANEMHRVKRSFTYPITALGARGELSEFAGLMDLFDERSTRAWRCRDEGQALTTSDVVRGIAGSYGLQFKSGHPTFPAGMDTSYDTRKPLRQQNMTDMEFLVDLADRRGCHVFVDPEDSMRMHFAPTPFNVTSQNIRFFWHGVGLDMIDSSRRDPRLIPLDLQLEITGHNIDLNAMSAGFIMTEMAEDGTERLVLVDRSETSGYIITYTLDESKLDTEEARRYKERFGDIWSSGNRWEETKKFWRQHGERKAHDIQYAPRRYFTEGWTLSGKCVGSTAIVVGGRYPIYNIEPFSGEYTVTKVSHTIGATWYMDLEFLMVGVPET